MWTHGKSINCIGKESREFKSQSIDCLAGYAKFAFSACKQIEKQLNYLNKNNWRSSHSHNQREVQHNENTELIIAHTTRLPSQS